MNTLGDRTRELLEAGRRDTAPARDRARVRAALALRLPIDPMGPGDSSAPPGGGVAASGAGTATGNGAGAIHVGLGKLVVGGLIIGATGFIAGYFSGGAGASRPVAVAVAPVLPSPHLDTAQTTSRTAAPAPEPVPEDEATAKNPTPSSSASGVPAEVGRRERVSTAPAASAAPSASAPTSSSLAEEAALLREAQAALRDGDAERSLAHLQELASRHPAGLLREERMAAKVLALCAAGQTPEAKAEADRFLGETPGSIHADRVRASCAFNASSQHRSTP